MMSSEDFIKYACMKQLIIVVARIHMYRPRPIFINLSLFLLGEFNDMLRLILILRLHALRWGRPSNDRQLKKIDFHCFEVGLCFNRTIYSMFGTSVLRNAYILKKHLNL